MKDTLTLKKRFMHWWKLEGKIDCAGALLVLLVFGVFWGNLLVEGILGIAVSIWCLSKIYFRKAQWAFFSLAAIWTLYQGLHALFAYYNR